jgi:D-alanine-D-alanine ligase
MKDMQVNLKNKTVTVLYGGTSSEREISLKSGRAVIAALQALQAEVQAIDVNHDFVVKQLPAIMGEQVFIILHGGTGENGTVQAVLEMAGHTYTGSGMAASSIAMSKRRTKQIWQATGLPTPKYELLSPTSHWAALERSLGNKMMIKPACEGSSIGMSIATDEQSFIRARDLAFTYDSWVLAEQWVNGEEYTVAILAGEALPAIRLKTDKTFYDFEAKYQSSTTQYLCPCGLSPAAEKILQQLALQAFHAVGCEGWGRVDVMRDTTGNFYLLEVNTVPGMTDHSLVPMAAKAAGMDFNTLVYRILQAKNS